MDVESARRRAISPELREKHIKRARKDVRLFDKWGRWWAAFYFLAGLVFMGLAGAFIWIVYRIVQDPLANPGPAAQNPVWQGFTFGILFGFFSGYLLLRGAFCIGEAIGWLRGKPDSRMLVEYHDALVNLMHEEQGRMADESDAILSQDSLSTSESNT